MYQSAHTVRIMSALQESRHEDGDLSAVDDRMPPILGKVEQIAWDNGALKRPFGRR